MPTPQEWETREGVHCVSKNEPTAAVNVVFVHGLGGKGGATWVSPPPSTLGFWPQAFASTHPMCSVWTVHYRADLIESIFSSAATMDLLDRAAWLLEELVVNDVPSKPIVFVAHSLGGVVVKQALQFSCVLGSARHRPVWEQTRCVFFLGTPHVGAGLANVAASIVNVLKSQAPLGGVLVRPSKAIGNLEKNNPVLRYLTDWYKDHAAQSGIETRAFAERNPCRGLTLVVDETSANPQVAGCTVVPVPDDHFSIAKPSTTTHVVYKALSEYVTDVSKVVAGSGKRPHQVADLVRGAWWERIDQADDPTAISFCELGFNAATGQMTIRGEGYGADGKTTADWHSVMGRLIQDEDEQLAMHYFWKGGIRVNDGKSKNREFNGYGLIRFSAPPDVTRPISHGEGFYWNVDEAQPTNTNYKEFELKRIVDAGTVQTMSGSQKSQKTACALAALAAWDTL